MLREGKVKTNEQISGHSGAEIIYNTCRRKVREKGDRWKREVTQLDFAVRFVQHFWNIAPVYTVCTGICDEMENTFSYMHAIVAAYSGV